MSIIGVAISVLFTGGAICALAALADTVCTYRSKLIVVMGTPVL